MRKKINVKVASRSSVWGDGKPPMSRMAMKSNKAKICPVCGQKM